MLPLDNGVFFFGLPFDAQIRVKNAGEKGDNVSITFGGQEVEVTVNDMDLEEEGYTVTKEGDAVVITFGDDDCALDGPAPVTS